MPFDGNRKNVEAFAQECNIYLAMNKDVYATDEAKITFTLSFMTEKEALKWKMNFIRSAIDPNTREIKFPTHKEFLEQLAESFLPENQTYDAIHQLALLKQGRRSAEEVITDFRLLISQAGYTSKSATDNLHLIKKLQNVLNPSLANMKQVLE